MRNLWLRDAITAGSRIAVPMIASASARPCGGRAGLAERSTLHPSPARACDKRLATIYCPEYPDLRMPDRSRKRPRDVNELAREIVDEATGEQPKSDPNEGKDPAAVALGRRGGLKGGKARAASMTPEERSEAARRAAQKRWGQR